MAWSGVSLGVGSVLGLLFVCVAGLGKLIPGHPMYNVLKTTYEKAIGPVFGMPASVLRLVIGGAELCAGLCMLLVVWSEYMSLPGLEWSQAG